MTTRDGTFDRDELQIQQLVSDLFIMRTGRTGKHGIRVPWGAFTYKRVAQFLASHPKWDSHCTTDGATGKPVGCGKDCGDDGDDVFTQGPIGIKNELKNEVEEQRRMRKEILVMNKHLELANHISLATSKPDRRVFLLSVIDKDTLEYAWLLKSDYRDEIANGFIMEFNLI